MQDQTTMIRKRTGFLLVLLVLLAAGALQAFAAQSNLSFTISPSGGGYLRGYYYYHGKKTYLNDRGGYFSVEIPDTESLGMTVYFEQEAAPCHSFVGYTSTDMIIRKDEKGIPYYKFTKNKDAGQIRHMQVTYKAEHKLTEVAKVKATCEKDGNKKYFKCSKCEKCFLDKNALNTTTVKEMTLPALGHEWGDWVVKRKPTSRAEGLKVSTCGRCKQTREESIAKLYVDPISENTISPDHPADFDQVSSKIKKSKFKNGITGDSFGLLQLRGGVPKPYATKLIWKKVPTAVKYAVFQQKNGGKWKKVTTQKARKYMFKKLKKGVYYKYVVVALNSKGDAVAVSKPVYVATRGGKYANIKEVTVDKDVLILKVNQTAVVKGTARNNKGTVKKFRALKYETSNMDVATVTSKGTVVAE